MSDSNQTKQFLSLLLQNQNRIYGFIFTLVPRRNEADDIMQETVMVMWTKFDDFEIGTNFYAWATRIARNKIMKHRESQKKGHKQFSDEALAEILSRNTQMIANIDERLKALEKCVTKLDQYDQHLIQLRYEKNLLIKDVASFVGRSVHGMYKTMARIHNILERCVKKSITS